MDSARENRPSRLLLLTGRPRTGKSTLIATVGAAFPGRFRGFVTEEIREEGERVGFRLRCWDGRSALFAHRHLDRPHRLGPYGVDLKVLDDLAVGEVNAAAQSQSPLLLDEIGRMQLYSHSFTAALESAVERVPLLVAAVQKNAHSVTDRLKARPDSELYRLTVPGRSALREGFLTRVRERLATLPTLGPTAHQDVPESLH